MKFNSLPYKIKKLLQHRLSSPLKPQISLFFYINLVVFLYLLYLAFVILYVK